MRKSIKYYMRKEKLVKVEDKSLIEMKVLPTGN